MAKNGEACPWVAQKVKYKVAGTYAYSGPLIITNGVLY